MPQYTRLDASHFKGRLSRPVWLFLCDSVTAGLLLVAGGGIGIEFAFKLPKEASPRVPQGK